MTTYIKGLCQRCGHGSFALIKRAGKWLCPLCSQTTTTNAKERSMTGDPWRFGASPSGQPHVYYEAGGDRAATGADMWAANRIADLEDAIIRMQRSVPGGTVCDPQAVADALREIAASVGVDVGQS